MRRVGGVRRRTYFRAALVTVVAVASCALGIAAVPSTASAYPASTVSIQGHGYGHGHGMGQWGALGYALTRPTTGHLGNYYGGTSLSALTGPQEATTVRVDMTENDGNLVIVTSATPFTVAGVSFGAGQVALMAPVRGAWVVWRSDVSGPWVALVSGVTDPTATPSPNDGSQTLTLCLGGTSNVTMHGSIEATYNSNGAARTVERGSARAVRPGCGAERVAGGMGNPRCSRLPGAALGIPGARGPGGGGRSYMMAGLGSYGGYADTCDLSCQTYRGTLNESPSPTWPPPTRPVR